MLCFYYVTNELIESSKKKLSSLANISKVLYSILSYEIVIFCKVYSSIIILIRNTAIPTLYTKTL